MIDIIKYGLIYLGIGWFLNFVTTLVFINDFIKYSLYQIATDKSKNSKTNISMVNEYRKTFAFFFSMLAAPYFPLIIFPALFGKNPFEVKKC